MWCETVALRVRTAMSMKRLAILAAVGQGGGLNGTYTILGTNMTSSPGGRSGGAGGSMHGNVNVLLGGAMLSGVILVVVLMCYCCHRNIRKNTTTQYTSYWRESESPLEVFTLGAQTQCYESAGLFLTTESHSLDMLPRPPTPGPPPAYEVVVALDKDKTTNTDPGLEPRSPSDKVSTPVTTICSPQTFTIADLPSDETGLPSYEAALKLEAGGYV